MVFAITSRSSTERHGDLSESVVFHLLPRCLFGFLGGSVWLFCVLLSCFLCLMVTPRYVSLILSYVGIVNRNKNVLMTVRASSAYGTGKKKRSILSKKTNRLRTT